MIVKCHHCGTEMDMNTQRFNRCPRHFCSRKCKEASQVESGQARFWVRVKTANANDCWPWHKIPKGTEKYPRVGCRLIQHNSIKVHRAAFYFAHGYLPQTVCHTCDNPPCCNPNHLYDGDHKTNQADAVRNGKWTRVAKLTVENVREIRECKPTPKLRRQLAEKFHVSEQAIIAVVKRRTWKDVA